MDNNQCTRLWYNDDKCSSCVDPNGYSHYILKKKKTIKKDSGYYIFEC